jgi:regulator of telomere elongation helicase 1
LTGTKLRDKCNYLNSKCKFNHRANSDKIRNTIRLDWGPLDIEDIIKAGETNEFCPYYQQMDRAEAADIIFMPYNYILDRTTRQSFEIDVSRSIIIFDEAHNLGS